jgi:hypothetical protein
MVETMSLIDDTVGLTLVETSKYQVLDGANLLEVCARLEI